MSYSRSFKEVLQLHNIKELTFAKKLNFDEYRRLVYHYRFVFAASLKEFNGEEVPLFDLYRLIAHDDDTYNKFHNNVGGHAAIPDATSKSYVFETHDNTDILEIEIQLNQFRERVLTDVALNQKKLQATLANVHDYLRLKDQKRDDKCFDLWQKAAYVYAFSHTDSPKAKIAKDAGIKAKDSGNRAHEFDRLRKVAEDCLSMVKAGTFPFKQ